VNYENIDSYQEKIKDFRLPSYGSEAAVMGLLAESGEVAAVFQKLLRGDYDMDTAATKLHYELGDILWHVAAIAEDNGWKISKLLQSNVDKLESRRLRNQILGSGDNR
jgi:NTP pyrophosphatase (non-canonical NTP hydrolase)